MSRHPGRSLVIALAVLVGVALPALALAADPTTPPPPNYKKVSSLVALPDFIPGLGTLYVDPKTLPVGPFLAYDRDGKLAGSIYMVPVKDLDGKKAFNDLAAAKEKVDHVDMYYNAGHPGVAEPHYHIAIWYETPDQIAKLKQ